MVVDLEELARRMLADYDARTPGERLGETIDLTTVQAYALQAEIARLRERRGEAVIGYKIGCTSRTDPGATGRRGADLRQDLRHGMSSVGRASPFRALRQPGDRGRAGDPAVAGSARRSPVG